MVRQHEEFLWLHDTFEENEEYAGIIVSWRQRSFMEELLITDRISVGYFQEMFKFIKVIFWFLTYSWQNNAYCCECCQST